VEREAFYVLYFLHFVEIGDIDIILKISFFRKNTHNNPTHLPIVYKDNEKTYNRMEKHSILQEENQIMHSNQYKSIHFGAYVNDKIKTYVYLINFTSMKGNER
jgi:hypothetical protein